jgi:hypothetical protein
MFVFTRSGHYWPSSEDTAKGIMEPQQTANYSNPDYPTYQLPQRKNVSAKRTSLLAFFRKKKLNTMAEVRKRTIPTERPLVGVVSENLCG